MSAMSTFVRAAALVILTVPMCIGIRANVSQARRRELMQAGAMTAGERVELQLQAQGRFGHENSSHGG